MTPTLEDYCQRRARTEVLRHARNQVRDQIKAEGGKVSHYAAKDITLRAEALIDADREGALRAAVGRLVGLYAKDRGMTVEQLAAHYRSLSDRIKSLTEVDRRSCSGQRCERSGLGSRPSSTLIRRNKQLPARNTPDEFK